MQEASGLKLCLKPAGGAIAEQAVKGQALLKDLHLSVEMLPRLELA